VKTLPKKCFTCPPCARQENTFSVYAGLTRDSTQEFLRVDEVSNDWDRCCCTPYHPLRLEVRQYMTNATDHISRFDSDHLSDDVTRDFTDWTTGRNQNNSLHAYKQQPVLFTIIRDDGVRCCKFPCKLLWCPVVCASCADGAHVYSGDISSYYKKNSDGKEIGRPHQLPDDRLIGAVSQPIGGGCFTPTLYLHQDIHEEHHTNEIFAKIEGPCCFGGLSELFSDFKFYTSKYHSEKKTGDVAMITKRHPSSVAMIASDILSDADNYTIEFSPTTQLTSREKATILSAQILADYMFFNGNTSKWHSEDNKTTVNLFFCSVIGCIIPCSFTFNLNN